MAAPYSPPAYQPGPYVRPSRTKYRIKIAVALIGVALFAWGLDYVTTRVMGDPDIAKVGSCVNDAENASLMKVVSCSDREATFQVIGKVDNVYSDDFDSSKSRACEAYPTTTRFFWKGRAGFGYVLCLVPRGREKASGPDLGGATG